MSKDNTDSLRGDTFSLGSGLSIYTKEDIKNSIKITNNRANYFANLAKKYRDEAKVHCENAKQYAEENSNVTYDQLIEVRTLLDTKINQKQEVGDYALSEDLPVNVSELLNDSNYVTQSEMDSAVESVIPDIVGNADKILSTDGTELFWLKPQKEPLFALKLFDHILSFEESKGYALQGSWVYKDSTAERYGYPTFYNKCIEEKNAATESQTVLGEQTITTYKNSNGHVFYDISDKAAVDAFFQSNGAAWMYGIDEENERVFLPRNNWFIQCTTDTSNVNNYNPAGLPNPNINVGVGARSGKTGISNDYGLSGHQFVTSTASIAGYLNFTSTTIGNNIYGKSTTVQPKSVNQLLYIVVGNTEEEQSSTEVTEVTTSENDTVPLGYSLYQGDGTQPSAAWLASNGQWNDGNLYSTFYNYYANKIGDSFAGGTIVESSQAYTDYDLVINQDDMTFRLPLLNGSEDLPTNPINKSLPTASGQMFTAEYNGMIYIGATTTATNQYIQLDNKSTTQVAEMRPPATGVYSCVSLWVNKGDTYMISGDVISTIKRHKLIKAKGNGTLYFKVANAVQNLELLDAGEVLESLADKISHQDCKAYITETYHNGTSWYRIYSDGWCEQGGYLSTAGSGVTQTITYLKQFANTNYFATRTNFNGTSNGGYSNFMAGIESQTVSTLKFKTDTANTFCKGTLWFVCGYLAEGEY